MKLATIGFYYDFTRFFASMHGRITPSGSITAVTNYATHASGYLFENAKGMRRVFLPVATRSARVNSPFENERLDWIGQYLVISGMRPERARKISQRYIAYFLEEFEKNRPDVVIIAGDTRMQSRSASYACRKLGIRHLYFEQGPFGTTILDRDGVNCTASFAKKFDTTQPSRLVGLDGGNSFNMPKKARVAERKAVRALDYFVQPIFLALGFDEIREEKQFLKQVSRHILTLKKKGMAETIESGPEPFVLVIGQVPTDANFSLNSPYSKPLQLVHDIEEMFPNKIVFREHPLFIGSYGTEFYSHFSANPRLKFSRGQRLELEIEGAKHIVVVNSTVGIEDVLKHRKPILCFGDASYTHLNGVFCRDRLEEYFLADPQISDVDHLANCMWFQDSFIPGHFRDQDLWPITEKALRRIDEI